MSLILADDMNMRLSSISQRLQLALSMIPIQKANVAEEKLVGGAGSDSAATGTAATAAEGGAAGRQRKAGGASCA